MEYKVPQNIDVEDRVVGPLTLRQFSILLIAASVVVILYLSIGKSAGFLVFIIAIILVAGAMALAFFDYGGQHLEKIIIDAIFSFFNPKKMVWKKEIDHQTEVTDNPQGQPSVAALPITGSLGQAKEKLHAAALRADSSQMSDTPGAPDPLMGDNPNLDKTLEEISGKLKKDEPLVSQLASVSPNKEFDNPKIEIKNHPYK